MFAPSLSWPVVVFVDETHQETLRTFCRGGCRANGFIHSPLLKTTGYEYRGLLHVVDWLPTMVSLAGGDPNVHPGSLDGYDVWEAITTNGPSPRTELLHNIDIFGGLGSTGACDRASGELLQFSPSSVGSICASSYTNTTLATLLYQSAN
jgi:hypothetical protein